MLEDVVRQMTVEQILSSETVPQLDVVPAPPPAPLSNVVPLKPRPRVRSRSNSKSRAVDAQMLQDQCRQLSLSVFFRRQAPVRSLGFTSSIGGEGKSLIAMVTTKVLAEDSSNPVTLLECNWAHPCLHKFLGCSMVPGVAEWLRGECSETAIRHQVSPNLTFIPAGESKGDAVKLLQQVQEQGLLKTFAFSNGLLIVDLPAIITIPYGVLAASLLEAIVVVARAGVTTDTLIAETCARLKDLPVQGIILNQVKSRVPRWIREIL